MQINALLGGEVRKTEQIPKYYKQLLWGNRLRSSIGTTLTGNWGLLPLLPKSHSPASIAAFAIACK